MKQDVLRLLTELDEATSETFEKITTIFEPLLDAEDYEAVEEILKELCDECWSPVFGLHFLSIFYEDREFLPSYRPMFEKIVATFDAEDAFLGGLAP